MKCFTVKIGDSRFVANVPRVIRSGWYGRRNGVYKLSRLRMKPNTIRPKGKLTVGLRPIPKGMKISFQS